MTQITDLVCKILSTYQQNFQKHELITKHLFSYYDHDSHPYFFVKLIPNLFAL